MKKLITIILVICCGATTHAQNPDGIELLKSAFEISLANNEYATDCELQYTHDVDTGSVHTMQVSILYADSSLKVDGEGFELLSTPQKRLFIDHTTKNATLLDGYVMHGSGLTFNALLEAYIPEHQDQVEVIDQKELYKISIHFNKPSIKHVVYCIQKEDLSIQSVAITGRVHPLYPDRVNAQTTVKFLSFNTRLNQKEAEELRVETHVAKNQEGFSLKRYSDYPIDIITRNPLNIQTN
jgi:hypothetical protein